jgi:hypothetical protein
MIDVLLSMTEEARQEIIRWLPQNHYGNGSKTLIIRKAEHGALLFQGDKMFITYAFGRCFLIHALPVIVS